MTLNIHESVSGSITPTSTPDMFELYGIDRDSVKAFEHMGFDQQRVIEVMRQIGIKKIGLNAPDGAEDRILEKLLQ